MSAPDDRAPATSPAGARPFICCSHCAHGNGYVHDSGCDDPFCTGYDERTPRASVENAGDITEDEEPEPGGATSAWEHHRHGV
jgi:hypothetical protein